MDISREHPIPNEPRLEYCFQCGNPTGRAGGDDDSIYIDDKGPYCEACYSKTKDEANAAAPTAAPLPAEEWLTENRIIPDLGTYVALGEQPKCMNLAELLERHSTHVNSELLRDLADGLDRLNAAESQLSTLRDALRKCKEEFEDQLDYANVEKMPIIRPQEKKSIQKRIAEIERALIPPTEPPHE